MSIPPRRSSLACLGLLALSALASPSASAQTLPQLAVYRGNAMEDAPNKVNAYATWLNQPEMWVTDGLGYGNWQHDYPGWQTGPWSAWLKARPSRKWLFMVPMLPSSPAGLTLAQGAAGAYNSHFRMLAQDLVAKGIANQVIIRLGWEMNGGWFPWAAYKDPQSFAPYWRQIVTTMRAVPGAAGIKFCFNPTIGWLNPRAATIYPGDDYVDYIALDFYDVCYAADTYPYPAGASDAEKLRRQKNAWNFHLNSEDGLKYWYNFAKTHNKPFGFGEWGVWAGGTNANNCGGDNPYYIQQMYNFMTANPVAFACYFDHQSGDGHHQLSPPVTEFPNSAALFKTLFSGPAETPVFTVFQNPVSNVSYIGGYGTRSVTNVGADAGVAPYEGANQYKITYTTNAGVQIAFNPKDLTTATHLRLAVKGPVANSTQRIMVRLFAQDGTGGAMTTLPRTTTYTKVDLPISSLSNGLSLNKVTSIYLYATTAPVGTPDTVYVDNIGFIKK